MELSAALLLVAIMTELDVLTLSGMVILAVMTALVAILVRHRPHTHAPRPQPYVGEFIPAETWAQRRDRERLSAWRAVIHNLQF